VASRREYDVDLPGPTRLDYLCWPLSPSAVIFWQLRHKDAMIRARGD